MPLKTRFELLWCTDPKRERGVIAMLLEIVTAMATPKKHSGSSSVLGQ
jgi:hypothetical protein